MARLIRLDGTGHTTLAEWTDADDAAFAEAVEEFRSQAALGYIGTVRRARGRPRTCASFRAKPTS